MNASKGKHDRESKVYVPKLEDSLQDSGLMDLVYVRSHTFSYNMLLSEFAQRFHWHTTTPRETASSLCLFFRYNMMLPEKLRGGRNPGQLCAVIMETVVSEYGVDRDAILVCSQRICALC